MGINNWLVLIKKIKLYIKQANENNHLRNNFLYQTLKNLLEMI
jgi:5-bromo-4-chloroindolyl phosphate hydrolysis protein